MFRKNIKLLSIFNFLIGFSLFAPLAIIYFSKVSGSYTLGTSVFGIIMLSSAIFEVPTGIWSDKVGRKYTVVLGSWARVLAYIFYAIGLSYWWLVIGAVFEGLSRAFYSGNNDALLYDTLADEHQLENYDEFQGKVSSTEQLASGISAILSGLIAIFSFQYLLWFSVLVQITLLTVSYLLIEPNFSKKLDTNLFAHIKEAISLFISNKKLRLLSLASILSYSISELKWEFTSAFVATVWPIWAIGISKTLPSFGAALSFYFSGKLIRKFKAVTILLFDSIYGKVISFVSLLFPTVFSPLLMSTPSLLYGVSNVAEKTLMQHEFSDHQRATMSSLNSLGGSVGFAIMSLVLGGLADMLGPAKALVILTIIGLPVIYLYWRIFKNDHDLIATKQ
jgi:MFS family permease